jgi:plasmid segregation protein ParM
VAFYADKERVKERLIGDHRVHRQGRRAQALKVIECRVIPQPFGALLSLALDSRGGIADMDLATSTAGVIDIGGKTTNLLSVKRLTEVSRETASVSVGIWGVARAVRAYLADHVLDLELRDHEVMGAVITRQVRYFGESIDLSEVIDKALSSLADQIIAEATQLWDGAAGLDVILVTGGGALLLGPVLQSHFRHARAVKDPVFANALGFWRLAQRFS